MNDVQIYENDKLGCKLRTFKIDGEPWFIAKDVCDALAIRSNTVRSILDADEVAESNVNTIGIAQNGGRNPLIVSEPGLYKLILKSRKPEAKAFQRWVTHEVLPAIRRDGGYMVSREEETPEELYARALNVLHATIERQKAEISEMRPKALFADAVGASDGTCLVGELAKMIRQNGTRLGQNRMFEMLRRDGFLGKSGCNRNVPTQRAMELGLFRIKETAVTHADGHVTLQRTPKVTGKGQRYFIDRYGDTELLYA